MFQVSKDDEGRTLVFGETGFEWCTSSPSSSCVFLLSPFFFLAVRCLLHLFSEYLIVTIIAALLALWGFLIAYSALLLWSFMEIRGFS